MTAGGVTAAIYSVYKLVHRQISSSVSVLFILGKATKLNGKVGLICRRCTSRVGMNEYDQKECSTKIILQPLAYFV